MTESSVRGWPGFDVRAILKFSIDAPDVNIKLVPASEEFQFFFRFAFLCIPPSDGLHDS